MSQNKLTDVRVYFNNKLLTFNTSCEINRDAKISYTPTNFKNAFYSGPRQMTVSFNELVPVAGMELDVSSAMKNGDVVSLTLVMAGKTLSTTGVIQNDSNNFQTETGVTASFNFIGEYASWQ